MSRIAVVAGHTGLTGESLLSQLLAHGAWAEVRALGRTPPRPATPSPRLKFIATDFTKLPADALAVDDVFCCLGTTLRRAGSRPAFERVDYHMVVDLARAAQAAGAKRFLVVSAVGASLASPAFYSRVKARMEQAVSELPFEAVHILRPSLLLGPRREFRPAEWLSQQLAPLVSPLFQGPLKRYRPVRADEVAAGMIRLALADARGVQVHHLPLD